MVLGSAPSTSANNFDYMTFLKYDINLPSPLLNIFSKKKGWEHMVYQAWHTLDNHFHSMINM